MFLFPCRFPSKFRRLVGCRRVAEGRRKEAIFGVKTESSRVCILHFLSKTIIKKNGPKTVLVKASICIIYILILSAQNVYYCFLALNYVLYN